MSTTTEAKSAPLHFFTTDTCPYAQRTWIALLEKEVNPSKPVNFTLEFVNLFGTKAPHFLAANPNGTVPAGTHNGQVFSESTPFTEYVNDVFASTGNALLPSTPEGRFRVKFLIDKHQPLTGQLFQLVSQQNVEEQKKIAEKTLQLLRALNQDIVGPYILGSQFTLVDISLLTFYERLITLGSKLRGFVVPDTEEYKKVHAWWAAVAARPSVVITRADRTPESLALYPLESKTRVEYLIESMEPLQYGMPVLGWARAKWAAGKPGVRAFTHEELLAAAKPASATEKKE